VYHFTDVPSLVSADSVVIFDPHTSYLPGATLRQPGLKINFTGPISSLHQQFPDQFEPYLLYGCNLRTKFNGTLFRFPLRNEVTVKKSQIKHDPSSVEDVLALFQSFKLVANDALLFLRNVRRVEVQVCDEAGVITTLFTASLQDPSQRTRGVWHQIPEFVAGRAASANGAQPDESVAVASRDAFYSKLATSSSDELPHGHQYMNVVLEEHAASSVTGAPPQATGVVRRTTDGFLLYEQLGRGKCAELAVEAAKKHFKLLPWGGVSRSLLFPRITCSELTSVCVLCVCFAGCCPHLTEDRGDGGAGFAGP